MGTITTSSIGKKSWVFHGKHLKNGREYHRLTLLPMLPTPTLWIGGAEDWNVPILGSEQMYQAMRRLGIESKLVVYPGEHHGIRRPSFQKDRYERYLEWFDHYVKGE
nr:prolyl oligopeptidase family serine peptidase [Rhodohalobacter halophilus]